MSKKAVIELKFSSDVELDEINKTYHEIFDLLDKYIEEHKHLFDGGLGVELMEKRI